MERSLGAHWCKTHYSLPQIRRHLQMPAKNNERSACKGILCHRKSQVTLWGRTDTWTNFNILIHLKNSKFLLQLAGLELGSTTDEMYVIETDFRMSMTRFRNSFQISFGDSWHVFIHLQRHRLSLLLRAEIICTHFQSKDPYFNVSSKSTLASPLQQLTDIIVKSSKNCLSEALTGVNHSLNVFLDGRQ